MSGAPDAAGFGLKPSVIERINAVLARTPAVERAVIYGSRAKGNYRAGSDIDLAVFGEALTEAVVLDISNRLDDLLLPWKIDLSWFQSIQNADLIDHIQRVGIECYRRASPPAA